MGSRVIPATARLSQRPTGGPNNLIAYESVDSTTNAGTNAGSIAVISSDPGSVPCRLTADPADNRNPAWAF